MSDLYLDQAVATARKGFSANREQVEAAELAITWLVSRIEDLVARLEHEHSIVESYKAECDELRARGMTPVGVISHEGAN